MDVRRLNSGSDRFPILIKAFRSEKSGQFIVGLVTESSPRAI